MSEISDNGSTDGRPEITEQDILDARVENQLKQLIKKAFLAVMFITAFVLADRFIPAMQNDAVRYMGVGMVVLSSMNAVGDLINLIIYKHEAVKNGKKK